MSSSKSSGFSLIEVLAALAVFSVAALGVTVAWRLADYKALVARLDHRAGRILREYYELGTFAPENAQPFGIGSSSSNQAGDDPLSGYLYHPRRDRDSERNEASSFDHSVPYIVSLSPDGKKLTLSYQLPYSVRTVTQTITKTVSLAK
jgi:prepilin-type N-terminal cleavage/methylation domain-containing protein